MRRLKQSTCWRLKMEAKELKRFKSRRAKKKKKNRKSYCPQNANKAAVIVHQKSQIKNLNTRLIIPLMVCLMVYLVAALTGLCSSHVNHRPTATTSATKQADEPLGQVTRRPYNEEYRSDKEARLSEVASELMRTGKDDGDQDDYPRRPVASEWRANWRAETSEADEPPSSAGGRASEDSAYQATKVPSNHSQQVRDANETQSGAGSELNLQIENQLEETTTTQTQTGSQQTSANSSVSPVNLTELTASTQSSRLVEFTPDILVDSNQESDKLSHLSAGHNLNKAGQNQSNIFDSFASVGNLNALQPPTGAQRTPRLELSGWQPTGGESSPSRPPGQIKDTNRNSNSRRANRKPKPAKSQRDSSPAWPANESQYYLHQSSLRPKHIPPPTLPAGQQLVGPVAQTQLHPIELTSHSHHEELDLINTLAGQSSQLQFQRPPLSSALNLNLNSNRLINLRPFNLGRPKQVSLAPSGSKKPTSLSKTKSLSDLFPRLAAKFFSPNGDNSKAPQEEILNQQQSFQLASHASHTQLPSAHLIKPQQPLPGHLFAKHSSIMKNLLSFTATPNQSNKHPIDQVATQNAENTQKLPSQLIFMQNGQVYSVQEPTGALKLPKQIQLFDHQTSETSDFPIFEAMTMNHNNNNPQRPQASAVWPTHQTNFAVTDQQRASSGPANRCDRPRHLIQADKTVVQHILSSQQNFVIARVPIKKYNRNKQPVVGTNSVNQINWMHSMQPSSLPANLYQTSIPISQQHLAPHYQLLTSSTAAVGQPSLVPATTHQLPAMASGPTTSIQVPGSTTIEFSSSRPGIFQSIANLIGSLRRRPSASASNQVVWHAPMAQASTIGPGQLLASPSGASMFALNADQPAIILTSRRRSDSWTPLDWLRDNKSDKDKQTKVIKSRGDLTIKDHSAYAASFLTEQLGGQQQATEWSPQVAAATNQQQVDPMRRLLMLKTSTDSEVCSPIGDMGAKIKYSCVPNSCVVSALNAAARGQSYLASQQVQQQQPSGLYNSNVPYKASNSFEHSTRNRQQQAPVQVEQYDDVGPTGANLEAGQPPVKVTYTHLNAYQAPDISRFVQQQPNHHQQFISSSQALEALSNNEVGEPFDYQTGNNHHQGNSRRQMVTTSSPFVPMTSSSPPIETSNGHQHPEVTYGTAFIRTSGQPAVKQLKHTTHKVKEVHEEEDFGGDDEGGPEDSYGSTPVEEPNEFLSAVNEQLERPIKAQAHPQVENGGSSAENALIENKSTYVNSRPSLYESHGKHRRLVTWPVAMHPQPQLDDQQDQDEEVDDYDGSGEHANEPIRNGAQPDLSRPITMNQEHLTNFRVDEMAMKQAAGNNNSKRRRHYPNMGRTTTSAPANNWRLYGQRQSTPLPPPEKPEAQQVELGTDEVTPSGVPPSETTECDCSTTLAPNNNNNNVEVAQNELEPKDRLVQSRMSGATNSTAKVRATQIRTTTRRPLSSSLAKDRRQTGNLLLGEQAPIASPFSFNAFGTTSTTTSSTTKRPYNLRNTTYKNLQFAHNHLSPTTLVDPSGPPGGSVASGDLSTTTASYHGSSLGPTTHFNQLMSANANNLTHFDDQITTPNNLLEQSSSTTTKRPPDQSTFNQRLAFRAKESRDGQTTTTTTTTTSTSTPTATTTTDGIDQLNRNSRDDNKGKSILAKSNAPATATNLMNWNEANVEVDHRDNNDQRGSSTLFQAPLKSPLPASNATELSSEDDNDDDDRHQEDDEGHAHPQGAKYRPSSVNDILALSRQPSSNFSINANQGDPTTARRRSSGHRKSASKRRESKSIRKEATGPPGDNEKDNEDDEDNDTNDVIPHQYQIQLRWKNESSLAEVASGGAPNKPYGQASSEPAIDKMKEKVDDRLFEHREEEHWHSKDWLRANKQIVGRPGKPQRLVDETKLDFGPQPADTPLAKDQLGVGADEQQVKKHFAIPTGNFRQPPELVEWIQRDVNLDEWPGEPRKRKRKSFVKKKQLREPAEAAGGPKAR